MSGGIVNRLDSMARRWAATEAAVAGSVQRLNSGHRIVTAADDAAGLSIAERLRSQATGSLRAQRNVMDGISLAQSADAVLGEVQGMLQRARELAVAYHHGTMSAADRSALQAEADALGAEAARLVGGATFNGVAFLAGGTITVQIGTGDPDTVSSALPNVAELLEQDPFYISGAGTTIVVTAPGGNANGHTNTTGNGVTRGGRGTGPTGGGTSTTGATATPIARIDQAIDAISLYRGTFGALQNRLEHALNNLAASHESLLSAESRIRDADMAAEMVKLTKYQILQQAGTNMLAQASQGPQIVLSLLR